MTKVSLWNAIASMRKLTAEGKPFSLKHYTYDRERKRTEGLRYVKSAILRPAAASDKIENADHKLFYKDLELPKATQNRNCWQVLIVEFNGIEVCL